MLFLKLPPPITYNAFSEAIWVVCWLCKNDNGFHSVTFGQDWEAEHQPRRQNTMLSEEQNMGLLEGKHCSGAIESQDHYLQKKSPVSPFPSIITLHFRREIIWNSLSWFVVSSPQGTSLCVFLIQIVLCTVHRWTPPDTAVVRWIIVINRSAQKRKCLPLNNRGF